MIKWIITGMILFFIAYIVFVTWYTEREMHKEIHGTDADTQKSQEILKNL